MPDHVVRGAVRLLVRAGHDTEIAGLRVDCAHLPGIVDVQPGDIVPESANLPAGLRLRRLQHREVGFAAGGRERRRQVILLAFRALDLHQQHVLGEPALVAGLPAGDAQRMALLAEQGVATVAGAEALDHHLFGKMHDKAPVGVEIAGRVKATDEATIIFDALECPGAHARHELHVGDDVGAVGDLDAAARVGRIERTHAIGHDVHGAAFHAAVEQRIHLRMRLVRVHPVVVRAGLELMRRADEGQVLDAGHVIGIGAMQVAVLVFIVQRMQ